MRKLKFLKRTLLILIAFLNFTSQVSAQTRTVTGTVTDQSGKGVPSVTVTVKGTTNSTQTNNEGAYRITASENSTLVFSSVGFSTRELPVAEAASVALQATAGNLNEIVVTGYGTSRRRDVTGAVTKVTAAEFNTGVITNPLQQVQGKVAGLVIVQPGSDPNSNVTVRLRGATSLEGQPPLLVIDGVAIDDFNRGINSLAPNDIESYDILRDASSAAIYGARGANGVIIITTKRGRSGRTQVDYSAFGSFETISKKLDVLSAAEWRAKVGANNPNDRGANTNWQDLITRNAYTQSHTLGISGGAGGFNYRASFNYLNNPGIVITTGKRLLSGRFTAGQRALNDRLNLQFGLNASNTNRDRLGDQGDARTGSPSNVFNLAFNYLPVWPVRDASGNYFQQLDFDLQNPVAFLNRISNKRRENFYQAFVRADYDLLKGLRVGTFAALSRANDITDVFNQGIPGETPGAPAREVNSASKSNDNKNVSNFDIHTNYRTTVGRHTFDVTGVYEHNKFINDGFGVNAQNFIVPELQNNNIGSTNDRAGRGIGSYKSENILISFLGRLVYNFDDRYLVTVNFRRDGSSRFGANNRWGNFPSAAFAWRLSNESFMKGISWLNDLKLRINYGLTGNQESIGNYQSRLLYGSAGSYLDYTNLSNPLPLQAYGITQLANPDLRWEVRKSLNFGVDFTLFRNRLNGTVDVFRDKTEDLLFQYDLPQPPFLYNRVVANAADAENKGVELTLNGSIISRGDFRWDARANLGSLRNRITNLSGSFQGVDLQISSRHYGFAQGRGLSNAYITELTPGRPAGVFWIPEFAGLDATGKQLYNDYDASGKLVGTTKDFADNDRVYIDPTPRFSWGFTNNLSYKNFDFSFFFRGIQGQKIFANSLMTLETTTRLPGNNVTRKALTNGFADQPQPSTYWLRNASFGRLENVTLGYNFKRGFASFIETMRVYVAANNLFVITPYEGIDPEIKVEGGQRYIDRDFYPRTRAISLGLNVTFK